MSAWGTSSQGRACFKLVTQLKMVGQWLNSFLVLCSYQIFIFPYKHMINFRHDAYGLMTFGQLDMPSSAVLSTHYKQVDRYTDRQIDR